MQRNFERALAFTLQFEGGYVNHPKDPGGATNKGITLATYRRYRKNATVADLKAIPDSMVKAIYQDGYWSKVGGDKLASAARYRGKGNILACALTMKHVCVIIFPRGVSRTGPLYRHEQAHCNGWPATHPRT